MEQAEQQELRSTYAYVDSVNHRIKAVAAMLGVSEGTLRSNLAQADINVKRQSYENPNAPAVRIFDLDNIFELARWRRENVLTKKASGPVYIAVEIIKGGTAKSTTSAEVGTQLALQGLKVLMIDLDLQANMSQLMGYESDLELADAEAYGLNPDAIVTGTFDPFCRLVLGEERRRPGMAKDEPAADTLASHIKYPFGKAGPAVIPADTYLCDLEHEFMGYRSDPDNVFREVFKRSAAGEIPGFNVNDFDVVLFDCPPSISNLSINAICCADIIIAPLRMDAFTVKGLDKLFQEIDRIRVKEKMFDYSPEVIILPTFHMDRVTRTNRMTEKLDKHANAKIDKYISQCEDFPQSTETYMPLSVQKPNSVGTKQYRSFTAESLLPKIFEIASKKGGNKK